MHLGIIPVFRGMQVTIIADKKAKDEWLSHGQQDGVLINWLEDLQPVPASPGILADLLFSPDESRISMLLESSADLVVINSVEHTLSETHESFVRINGWKTFLGSAEVEASAITPEKREAAEKLFSLFNKTIAWVPDITGFITPRIIASIINEAYLALSEQVSTRKDIDTAMKLGTNYPYGPFDWADQIGKAKIHALLTRLAREHGRYTPAFQL